MVLEGAMNGAVFQAYLQQVLIPTWHRATSSSWTICPHIRRRECVTQSKLRDVVRSTFLQPWL